MSDNEERNDESALKPLLVCDGEKDERFDGVKLISSTVDEKVTAENCGHWWYIRDWEIYEKDGIDYWFCRSGYTITKEMIKLLSN